MKNIKIITLALVLMTTSAFSDFTIKDLFVSGGTQTTEKDIKDKGDNKSTDEIVHTNYK